MPNDYPSAIYTIDQYLSGLGALKKLLVLKKSSSSERAIKRTNHIIEER